MPTASPTSTASSAAPPLAGAHLRALLDFLRPRPEELRWQAVPWQTDLRQARRLAAASGKPIFLWAMNGNPLGCT